MFILPEGIGSSDGTLLMYSTHIPRVNYFSFVRGNNATQEATKTNILIYNFIIDMSQINFSSENSSGIEK